MPSLADLGIERNESLIRGGEGGSKSAVSFRRQVSHYETSRNRMDFGDEPVICRPQIQNAHGVWQMHESVPDTTKDAFVNGVLARVHHSTLWDRPHVLTEPFNPRYRDFPYENNPTFLALWKRV